MQEIKLWGWEKKRRTLFRFIKPGDIFCFQLKEKLYGFGRIISPAIMGHFVEIFVYVSENPVIRIENINKSCRLMQVMQISTYMIFDCKEDEGDWRIIGHQEHFVPKDVDGVYFTYGVGSGCKKVDVFGNEWPIKEEEQSNYLELCSYHDCHIKKMVFACLGLKYEDAPIEIPKRTQEDAKGDDINNNDYVTSFKDEESIEICMDAGHGKVMVAGEKISAVNEDACMNGYNWDALFSCYLKKHEPDILKEMETDPEADMYTAFYPLTPENESRAERFVEIIRLLIEQEDKLCQFVKEESDEIEWD